MILVRALLAGAMLAACGARTSPLSAELNGSDETSAEGGGGGAGGSPAGGDGACIRCDGHATCDHCLVQGHDESYACPIGVEPPDAPCMNLLEQFRGDDGREYTCYYCGGR